MFYVKVNATTANVCVGFDVLGMALDMANLFTFERKTEFSFVGFEPPYRKKENNLVYKAYAYTFKKLNRPLIPVEIGFQGAIPICRGLGSSSSLIVGGVCGANAVMNQPLSKEEILNICCEIEGHPDNVAPAIFGGFVASYKVNTIYKCISYPVADKLHFTVGIPSYPISTKQAREVLPKEVKYADIVHNLGRIVHLPKALNEGNVSLLKELFDDRLHEPYRKSLIAEYDTIKEICKEKEVALAISGSGSTLLLIGYKDNSMIFNPFGFITKDLKIGQGVKVWEE